MLKSLLFFSISAFLIACGVTPDISKPNVINGTAIDADTFPFAVEINGGECTAAFVSDNTLVTAGHCVARGVKYNGVEGETFIHRDYKRELLINDVAVVVFDRAMAPAIVPIDFNIPAVGKVAQVIGFGCSNHDGSGVGTKRTGRTSIESNTDGKLRFVRRPTQSSDPLGQNIAACPGDSGGPMIVDGRLVGIASYIMKHTTGVTESFYAAVGAQSNADFFMRAALRGALIPGLPEPNPRPNPTDPVNPNPPQGSWGGRPDDHAVAHLKQMVDVLNTLVANCSFAPNGVIQGQESGHYTYGLVAFDQYGRMSQQYNFQSNFRLRRPQDSAQALADLIPQLAFPMCTRRS